MNPGSLTFFCGKMGAGKTTMALELANQPATILLSEDEWLAAIYPDEISNLDDYIHCSTRLKPLLKAHIQNLLNAGVSVVMDFPGNTRKQRAWFREIVLVGNFPHKLIYLDVSCLQQIAQRALKQAERARFDTETVFHQVNSYFQPPSPDEGLNIEVINRQKA